MAAAAKKKSGGGGGGLLKQVLALCVLEYFVCMGLLGGYLDMGAGMRGCTDDSPASCMGAGPVDPVTFDTIGAWLQQLVASVGGGN